MERDQGLGIALFIVLISCAWARTLGQNSPLPYDTRHAQPGFDWSVTRHLVTTTLEQQLVDLLKDQPEVIIAGCAHKTGHWFSPNYDGLANTAVTCLDTDCAAVALWEASYENERSAWSWRCVGQHAGAHVGTSSGSGAMPPPHVRVHRGRHPLAAPGSLAAPRMPTVVITATAGMGIPLSQASILAEAMQRTHPVLTVEVDGKSGKPVLLQLMRPRLQLQDIFTLAHNSFNQTFADIYNNKQWSDEGAGSGMGSSLNYTEVLRAELPKLLVQHGIKSMVDTSCGGMLWMPLVLAEVEKSVPGFKFTGNDVACSMVEKHKATFADHTNWSFGCSDASNQPLPQGVDLVFSRDSFQHLPLRALYLFLHNVKASGARYMLIGSYISRTGKGGTGNINVHAGGMYDVDVTAPPFNLRPTVQVINEKTKDEKHMLLFDVSTMEWDEQVDI